MPSTMEVCGSCGNVIGNLETPQVWKDEVVCEPCLRKLSGAAAPAPPAPRRILGKGEMICQNSNCGHVGKPVKKSRGSLMITIILLCIGIIPGILYIIFCTGTELRCAVCGMTLRK